MIPALKRGLDLLKIVLTSEGPIGYNELLAATGFPASSATRLLKSLEEGRYIVKDPSGKYRAGNQLLVLGRGVPVFTRLLSASKGVLGELSRKTGNTALLVFWNGREQQCIDKVVDSFSIAMQEVGNITRDPSATPWGWLFWASLDASGRKRAEGEIADAARFRRAFPGRMAWFEKHGFTYDDAAFYPHVRRLAAPVLEAGRTIAAVGLGGNTLTIPDQQVLPYAALVKAAAEELTLGTRT
ncbi:MAG: helix-turn-helix domain-containing protein [Spirochaetes bacterium]|nr:helix-turn-helix domain-containing protein [Spirochaetota bacterium]